MSALYARGRAAALMAFAAVGLAGVLSGAALDRYVLFLWRSPDRFDGPPRGRGPDGRFIPPGPPGGPYGRGRGPGRGELGPGGPEFLAHELDLSPEQRASIDSLMARQAEKLRAARERIRPEIDAVASETEHEVERRLTDEQRERYRELRSRMGRRGRGPPPR